LTDRTADIVVSDDIDRIFLVLAGFTCLTPTITSVRDQSGLTGAAVSSIRSLGMPLWQPLVMRPHSQSTS